MLHIHGLPRRFLEHIACGRFYLFYLVPAGIQIVDMDNALFIRIVKILIQFLVSTVLILVLCYPNLKLGSLDAITDNTVNFLDGQTGLLLVFNADLGGLAGTQIYLVWGAVENVTLRGLDFGDDVVPFRKVLLGNDNLAVGIHRVIADFHASFGFDLKERAGQVFAVDIHLHNLQRGPLMILELHLRLLVGEQCHVLRRGVQDVVLRDALLCDGVHAGQQVLDHNLAVCTSGFGGDRGTVCTAEREGHAGDRVAGILIPLADNQLGPFIVTQPDFGSFSGEQLHMMLKIVQDMIRQRSDLLHGVHAGFQIFHKDFAAVFCCAVQIAAAVSNSGNAEGNAIQRCSVRAGFDEPETGLLCVCEHKEAVSLARR